MNRKLIYLSFIRLTDKVSRDWYIDYCIERGAVVEYWDIVSLVREEHQETGTLDVGYLRYINTYDEFESLIQQPENQDAVYVMLITYSGRSSKPFRLLTKYNCKMIFLSWGAMPTTASVSRFRRTVYRLFSNPINFIKTAANLILSCTYRKLNLVRKFDIVFAAGSALTSVDQYAKKTVHFNLCDFDHYRRINVVNDRLVQGKYAVFLDINLPYQSDLANIGLPAVTPASYFNSLNRFFNLLEDAYGIKVVIAAHPKAAYSNTEYNQREIHRLVTAELVKDSEFVITHTSTALSYAVLNYKPSLFIYTDEMAEIYKNTVMVEIVGLASYLNAALYNVDELTDGNQINIQQPNRERYEHYKYSFLTTPESENLMSAEIFWREIIAL
jgi:hypothetical protein